MTANINPTTNIAYGYISAHALAADIVDDLMYGPQAKNLSYTEQLKEHLAWAGREYEESFESDEEFQKAEPFDEEAATEVFGDNYTGEEETIEGVMQCPGYGPVYYSTSWLGGALNFWIFQSPFSTDKARRASPCVPGAGILDTLDGSETSYDVPADWRHQE